MKSQTSIMVTLLALSAIITSILSVVVGPQGIFLPVGVIVFSIALRGHVKRKPFGSLVFWVVGSIMLLGLCSQLGYLLRISGIPGLDAWSNASIVLSLTAGFIAARTINNHKRRDSEQSPAPYSGKSNTTSLSG